MPTNTNTGNTYGVGSTTRAKWAQDLTQKISFYALRKFVLNFADLLRSTDQPNYRDALRENAFLNRSARAIVYGHTHHYMLVPLKVTAGAEGFREQMYLSPGTWRPYHELAKRHPSEEEFVPYQLMTYLAFSKKVSGAAGNMRRGTDC